MARETTMQGRIGKVGRVLARLTSNREELKHFEPSRLQLEGLFGRIQEAADQQAFHTANKQEASKQVQTLLVEAERLVTVLQFAVKQHYGIRSEKLADFGMQPFRGRTKASLKQNPNPPAPEPTAPSPTDTDRS